MKKKRLKKNIVIGIYLIAFTITGITSYLVSQNMKLDSTTSENLDYVTDTIIDDNNVEVIKEETKLIKPYTEEKVEILKYFYDYQADDKTQEKSIIYHQNTYIQNSGMDFGLAETFDIVAVLDGTVTDVKEDELLGTIVEIKHDNDLISSYQSLSSVSVKKNDTVKQGQVIAKSGTNTIDKDLGNHLHFELYKKGEVVDPNKYFDQVITNDSDISKENEESITDENSQTEKEKKAE